MSTIDVGLLLNGVGRDAMRSADSTLRVVLVEGEALKLPRSSVLLRVLSGSAWVSQAGRDTFLQAGERFHPADGRDDIVVSPLGPVPLLLEMR
jgi:Protein of unknown function (DUF2917)